jgi:hypothetical protein
MTVANSVRHHQDSEIDLQIRVENFNQNNDTVWLDERRSHVSFENCYVRRDWHSVLFGVVESVTLFWHNRHACLVSTRWWTLFWTVQVQQSRPSLFDRLFFSFRIRPKLTSARHDRLRLQDMLDLWLDRSGSGEKREHIFSPYLRRGLALVIVKN